MYLKCSGIVLEFFYKNGWPPCHMTHLSLANVELTKAENVSLIKLPTHCTNVLQPLDVSCFSPLKAKYEQFLINFVHRTEVRQKTELLFVILFKHLVWGSNQRKHNFRFHQHRKCPCWLRMGTHPRERDRTLCNNKWHKCWQCHIRKCSQIQSHSLLPQHNHQQVETEAKTSILSRGFWWQYWIDWRISTIWINSQWVRKCKRGIRWTKSGWYSGAVTEQQSLVGEELDHARARSKLLNDS